MPADDPLEGLFSFLYSNRMTITVQENIPLAVYTIYKIGGPARFFAEARNSKEVQEALEFARSHKLPFFILGAGSNVLISDAGFNGIVIHSVGGGVRVEGERISADAGVMMARAVTESARAGLAGFEWGIGVPGTIGGSVRGNAGCFGGEMKDVIESVEVLDAYKLTTSNLELSECQFSYRDSVFKQHPEWIILSATLKLRKGDSGMIQREISRITAERISKQAIGTKSCGCIFKNIDWGHIQMDRSQLFTAFPELKIFQDRPNIPAAFLIDKAGLKGHRVNSIVISEKHANFFVNEGGGAARDVRTLIDLTKKEVQKKYGLILEEEIQYVGLIHS